MHLLRMLKLGYTMSHDFLAPGQNPSLVKQKSSPKSLNDEEIIELTKMNLEKDHFNDSTTKEEVNIYYKTKYFGPFYAYWFSNEEEAMRLKGKMTFKMKNLALEDPDEDDPNAWTIDLLPGASFLKKISTIEENGSSSISSSITYSTSEFKEL